MRSVEREDGLPRLQKCFFENAGLLTPTYCSKGTDVKTGREDETLKTVREDGSGGAICPWGKTDKTPWGKRLKT